ncbi:hypothetical protein MPDQ_004324 [Monascus purpureus]|uniref:DUF7770 domain-containing protein n=1 Tax=Monascus purpureus TaxID=5098 RepID=A0A507R224_MONPU|nr:hypothetical protein MPDQ_004324 [Monascus purpureus]
MIKARAPDVMGTFNHVNCLCADSATALPSVNFHAVHGLTVGQVLQLIDRNGRSRHKLARSGLGYG